MREKERENERERERERPIMFLLKTLIPMQEWVAIREREKLFSEHFYHLLWLVTFTALNSFANINITQFLTQLFTFSRLLNIICEIFCILKARIPLHRCQTRISQNWMLSKHSLKTDITDQMIRSLNTSLKASVDNGSNKTLSEMTLRQDLMNVGLI